MALTPDTAAQAGVIAAQIVSLQASLAVAQEALSVGVVLQSHSAVAYLDGQEFPLSCAYTLSAADSSTMLNALVAIYTSNISALTAQLAAM